MRALLVVALILALASSAAWATIVPGVVGETESVATAMLTGAGFTVGVVYQVGAVGVVLAQSPESGIDHTGEVTITVGRETTVHEDGESLYRVVLNHVLSVFGVGVVAGLFIKITNRS